MCRIFIFQRLFGVRDEHAFALSFIRPLSTLSVMIRMCKLHHFHIVLIVCHEAVIHIRMKGFVRLFPKLNFRKCIGHAEGASATAAPTATAIVTVENN